MNTLEEKTVRDIAVENPGAIRIFEELGIDYCCGGNCRLADECARAGMDAGKVCDRIAAAQREGGAHDSEDWTRVSLSALMHHIVDRHHAYVRKEAPRIRALLEKVIARHGNKQPELVQAEYLFAALSRELNTHIFKEERAFFPYIEELEQAARTGQSPPPAFFGPVSRPIGNMTADHHNVGALLKRIREITNGYSLPPGACPTLQVLYQALAEFEEDLHRHVHLENNVLFPAALLLNGGSGIAGNLGRG